jgi:hypothetical protein
VKSTITFGTGTCISFQDWHAPISRPSLHKITPLRQEKSSTYSAVSTTRQLEELVKVRRVSQLRGGWKRELKRRKTIYDIIDATPKAFFGLARATCKRRFWTRTIPYLTRLIRMLWIGANLTLTGMMLWKRGITVLSHTDALKRRDPTCHAPVCQFQDGVVTSRLVYKWGSRPNRTSLISIFGDEGHLASWELDICRAVFLMRSWPRHLLDKEFLMWASASLVHLYKKWSRRRSTPALIFVGPSLTLEVHFKGEMAWWFEITKCGSLRFDKIQAGLVSLILRSSMFHRTRTV